MLMPTNLESTISKNPNALPSKHTISVFERERLNSDWLWLNLSSIFARTKTASMFMVNRKTPVDILKQMNEKLQSFLDASSNIKFRLVSARMKYKPEILNKFNKHLLPSFKLPTPISIGLAKIKVNYLKN